MKNKNLHPDEQQTPGDGPLRYLLTAYLFDNVSEDGKKEVEEHLEASPESRTELAELRDTLVSIEDALGDTDEESAKYSFEARRLERVLAASKQRPWYRSRGFLALSAAAAAAAMILVGVLPLVEVITNRDDSSTYFVSGGRGIQNVSQSTPELTLYEHNRTRLKESSAENSPADDLALATKTTANWGTPSGTLQGVLPGVRTESEALQEEALGRVAGEKKEHGVRRSRRRGREKRLRELVAGGVDVLQKRDHNDASESPVVTWKLKTDGDGKSDAKSSVVLRKSRFQSELSQIGQVLAAPTPESTRKPRQSHGESRFGDDSKEDTTASSDLPLAAKPLIVSGRASEESSFGLNGDDLLALRDQVNFGDFNSRTDIAGLDERPSPFNSDYALGFDPQSRPSLEGGTTDNWGRKPSRGQGDARNISVSGEAGVVVTNLDRVRAAGGGSDGQFQSQEPTEADVAFFTPPSANVRISQEAKNAPASVAASPTPGLGGVADARGGLGGNGATPTELTVTDYGYQRRNAPSDQTAESLAPETAPAAAPAKPRDSSEDLAGHLGMSRERLARLAAVKRNSNYGRTKHIMPRPDGDSEVEEEQVRAGKRAGVALGELDAESLSLYHNGDEEEQRARTAAPGGESLQRLEQLKQSVDESSVATTSRLNETTLYERNNQRLKDATSRQYRAKAAVEKQARVHNYFQKLDRNVTLEQVSRLEVPAPAIGDEGLGQEAFRGRYGVNPFVQSALDNQSTFAMDVDTASFTRALATLKAGKLPATDGVRVEEFVNYFRQDYPAAPDTVFSVFSEGGPSPFGTGVELLKITVKARELRTGERKDSVLTLCIDTSGSMFIDKRLQLVKNALSTLLDGLRPEDRVAIVAYNAQAYLAIPHTSAREKERLLGAIDALSPGGASNVEAGLELAYRVADDVFQPRALNRVILLSDGVATVGARGPEKILEKVKVYARRGIFLSAVGFGRQRYDDAMMERLSNEGNGRYDFVSSVNEARRIFAKNLPATLQVLAQDAKIQVEFAPNVVASYRLLGYENRAIKDHQFRDDKVDAGEVGPGTTVTALYEILRQPNAHGALGRIFVRYRDTGTGRVEELNFPLAASAVKPSLEATSDLFRFIACAAEIAELLRDSYWARDGSYSKVLKTLDGLSPGFRAEGQWAELHGVARHARHLTIPQLIHHTPQKK
jgi:Ca-activated chloride channel family protein